MEPNSFFIAAFVALIVFAVIAYVELRLHGKANKPVPAPVAQANEPATVGHLSAIARRIDDGFKGVHERMARIEDRGRERERPMSFEKPTQVDNGQKQSEGGVRDTARKE